MAEYVDVNNKLGAEIAKHAQPEEKSAIIYPAGAGIEFNASGYITLHYPQKEDKDGTEKIERKRLRLYYSYENSGLKAVFGKGKGKVMSMDDNGAKNKPKELSTAARTSINLTPDQLEGVMEKIKSYDSSKYSTFSNNRIDFLKDIANEVGTKVDNDTDKKLASDIASAYKRSNIYRGIVKYAMRDMSRTNDKMPEDKRYYYLIGDSREAKLSQLGHNILKYEKEEKTNIGSNIYEDESIDFYSKGYITLHYNCIRKKNGKEEPKRESLSLKYDKSKNALKHVRNSGFVGTRVTVYVSSEEMNKVLDAINSMENTKGGNNIEFLMRITGSLNNSSDEVKNTFVWQIQNAYLKGGAKEKRSVTKYYMQRDSDFLNASTQYRDRTLKSSGGSHYFGFTEKQVSKALEIINAREYTDFKFNLLGLLGAEWNENAKESKYGVAIKLTQKQENTIKQMQDLTSLNFLQAVAVSKAGASVTFTPELRDRIYDPQKNRALNILTLLPTNDLIDIAFGIAGLFVDTEPLNDLKSSLKIASGSSLAISKNLLEVDATKNKDDELSDKQKKVLNIVENVIVAIYNLVKKLLPFSISSDVIKKVVDVAGNYIIKFVNKKKRKNANKALDIKALNDACNDAAAIKKLQDQVAKDTNNGNASATT